MKSDKERRDASRDVKKKTKIFSTSKARANFAAALETAHREHTVIGFGRYNQLIAALVPIDAIRILAGRAPEVDPAVRDKLVRMAKLFLREPPTASDAPAPAKRARATPRTKKAKRKTLGKSA